MEKKGLGVVMDDFWGFLSVMVFLGGFCIDYHDLIRRLDPEYISRATDPIVVAARSFPIKSNTVGSYHEFTSIITQFYIRLRRAHWRLGDVEINEDGAYHELKNLLGQDPVIFYDSVRTGTDGGLGGLLHRIQEKMLETAVEGHITGVLDLVDPHDYQGLIDIITELKKALSGFGFPQKSAEVIAGTRSWKRLIREHVMARFNYRMRLGR